MPDTPNPDSLERINGGSRSEQTVPARRWLRHADLLLVAALGLHYLWSFGADSPVHGPGEVFGQDSGQIILSLSKGEVFPWNPQNHLLYHSLVAGGSRVWCTFVECGPESTFRFLKLFTALTGVGFLLAFRWLLLELGLGTGPRAAVLALTGISVSAWFNFSAFETHGLTMPWLALYLVAVLRLARRERPTKADHLLFILSLAALGWARVDSFRFALVSLVLLILPTMRGLRRPIARDLALVLVLFLAGNGVMGLFYLDRSLDHERAIKNVETLAGTFVFKRSDRPSLERRLNRIENITPRNLWVVGRAIGIYGILMPIGDPDESPIDENSSAAERELGRGVDGGTSGWLFTQPIRNLLPHLISALALIGVVAVWLRTLAFGLPGIMRGNAFLAVVAAQWIAGWLLYTWFNPYEPALWTLQFVPLLMAAVADTSRDGSRWWWVGLGVLACAVALHNWQWFYLVFR